MSALPRHPRESGYAGLRMTADEYLALGETTERYQLIDGVVCPMTPSPFAGHNELLLEIAYQFKAFTRAGGPARTFVESDLRLGPTLVYRPDVCVYVPSRLPEDVQRLESPPDLIVEILSDSTRASDLLTKRDDYERFGVVEYWTTDPADGRLRCWRSQGARLVETAVEGDELPSVAIPGFTLDLRPVRAVCRSTRG